MPDLVRGQNGAKFYRRRFDSSGKSRLRDLSDEQPKTQTNVVLAFRLQRLRLNNSALACNIDRAVTHENGVIVNLKDAHPEAVVQLNVKPAAQGHGEIGRARVEDICEESACDLLLGCR